MYVCMCIYIYIHIGALCERHDPYHWNRNAAESASTLVRSGSCANAVNI